MRVCGHSYYPFATLTINYTLRSKSPGGGTPPPDPKPPASTWAVVGELLGGTIRAEHRDLLNILDL